MTHQTYCTMCESGRFVVECCNGSGGCSCMGQPVDTGPCRVCHGTGLIDEASDLRANIRSIEGLHFIGTGPKNGRWQNARRGGY